MTLRDLRNSIKDFFGSANENANELGDLLLFKSNWLDAPIWMIIIAIPILFYALQGIALLAVIVFHALGGSTTLVDEKHEEFHINIFNPNWRQASVMKKIITVIVYASLGFLVFFIFLMPIFLTFI